MKRVESLLKKLWKDREIVETIIFGAQEALDDLYYSPHDFSSRRAYEEYEKSLYAYNEKNVSIMTLIDRRIFNIVKRYSNIEKISERLKNEFSKMLDTDGITLPVVIKIGDAKIAYDVYDDYGELVWYLDRIIA